MGFNKRYLPDLAELKSIRERMNDDSRFLEIYLYKPDALIGPTESMEYLHKLEREIQK
jgi:hypothetical protein